MKKWFRNSCQAQVSWLKWRSLLLWRGGTHTQAGTHTDKLWRGWGQGYTCCFCSSWTERPNCTVILTLTYSHMISTGSLEILFLYHWECNTTTLYLFSACYLVYNTFQNHALMWSCDLHTSWSSICTPTNDQKPTLMSTLTLVAPYLTTP